MFCPRVVPTSAFVIAFLLASPVNAQVVGSPKARKAVQDYGDKQAEFLAEHKRDMENGKKLFGENKRWKDSGYRGTISGKRAPDYKLDDWGNVGDSFRAVQKISDKEYLVISKYKASPVMLLRGLDMSKVTDGAEFALLHPVLIPKTYTYTTVTGASKTVLVLEVNDEAIDKLGSPEVVTDEQIDGVKKEIEKIKAAMKADEDRLKNARTAKDKANYSNWIKKYKDRLAAEEKKLKDLEAKKAAVKK